MKELRRITTWAEGCFPETSGYPDEIGDTGGEPAVARVAHPKVLPGRGWGFNTLYEPPSDDDASEGVASDASSLARNERELEGTSSAQRNWPKRRKVENVLGDLPASTRPHPAGHLPSDQERREVLSESAVYQPRDVVPGIYSRPWAAAACSDDAGHGVPGAFLSLVGHNALDRVTKVYTERICRPLEHLSPF